VAASLSIPAIAAECGYCGSWRSIVPDHLRTGPPTIRAREIGKVFRQKYALVTLPEVVLRCFPFVFGTLRMRDRGNLWIVKIYDKAGRSLQGRKRPEKAAGVCPARIDKIDWIIPRIDVKISTAKEPEWILIDEPANLCVIVSGPVEAQPGFGIEVAPGVLERVAE
jgi:hypothetical protein